MRRQTITLVMMVFLLCGATACRQPEAPEATQSAPASAIETAGAVEIPGVVAAGTMVQVVAELEGNVNAPMPLPDGSGMFFCQFVPAYVVVGGQVTTRCLKIDKNGQVSTFLENSQGAVTMSFDLKGRLIANEIQPRGETKVAVIYPPGQEVVLAANFDGKAFGLPNEIVVSKKDGVYFTDSGANEEQLKAGYVEAQPAVYYIPPGGKTMKIADDIGRPVGIQLSPDETTLYIVDSTADYLLAYDVQPDGTIRNRRNFAKWAHGRDSGPDGLAIDNDGRLYAVAKDGVEVVSPQGQHLGIIPVAPRPNNLAFGGQDKKTLYLTGRPGVRKIQMIAQGVQGRAR